MKFLRRITREEINLLSEINQITQIEETKRKEMCNKIISNLEEKFHNDPIAFENHNGRIIIYSTEAKKIEEAKNYLQSNFHQEFIPVDDAIKFRYMVTNLKMEIDKLADANDSVSIFPSNTVPGYVVLAYGNKKDFDDFKIKLRKTIECINRAEVKLEVQSISENAEIMLEGIEKKWNVIVDVSNPETPRGQLLINWSWPIYLLKS